VKIFNNIENLKFKNPVITVGSFDGIHLGHKKLLKHLQDVSKNCEGESIVFTFAQHPRKLLNPSYKTALLQTNEEKIHLFEKIGIDNLILYDFTYEFSQLTSCQFIENILVSKLGINKLIVGFNHHFGKDKMGDFDKLKNCVQKYNFDCEKVTAELSDNEEISSSKIRNLIDLGEIELANKLLDYEYFSIGTVVEGNRLGRTINFPTINVSFVEDKIMPLKGVYATKVFIDNIQYFGMANIGLRPTVVENQTKPNLEVHIFDFNQDVYGKTVKISFIKRFRAEKKFNNFEELKIQLEKDKLEISKFISNTNVTI